MSDKEKERPACQLENAPTKPDVSHCNQYQAVITNVKQIITDRLGEGANLDVRRANKLSRRVEHMCSWLREA